jgi:hypothetical protein
MLFLRYGTIVFDEDEFAECSKKLGSHYYSSLGAAAWTFPSPGFWTLQRECLESCGRRLSLFRTLIYAVRGFLELILNPLDSARRVISFLR